MLNILQETLPVYAIVCLALETSITLVMVNPLTSWPLYGFRKASKSVCDFVYTLSSYR